VIVIPPAQLLIAWARVASRESFCFDASSALSGTRSINSKAIVCTKSACISLRVILFVKALAVASRVESEERGTL